jgi:hypothetical protein
MRALESRVYKYKNKNSVFFCPLCRTERGISTSPRLSRLNIVQILLTSLVLMGALYPFMGVKSFFVFFIVWAVFELGIRTDYKKQVACPHCGFDATWYKKDVKVARQLVKDFWAQKQPVSENKVQPKAQQL